MQLKRELITAKSEVKIQRLQEEMASSALGVMTALQPEQRETEKLGKRILRDQKQTDVIAHVGFDRVFVRKNEQDFPDYYMNGVLKESPKKEESPESIKAKNS